MKKLSKIFLALALVLVFAVPFVFAGCENGASNAKEEGIKIHTTFKTEYEVGEDLDVTNGKLVYTDTKGKETVVAITADMITSFSTATVGTRQMIVTYQGFTTLVDYEVYQVVDVNVGDLFYCRPALFGAPTPEDVENYYTYVKFSADSKVSVDTSSAAPADYVPNGYTQTFNTTKEKVNKKYVYTITNPFGSNGSIVITVVDENTISVTATNSTTNVTRSGTLTRYVG